MLPIDMINCEGLQTLGKPTSCAIALQADTLRSIHMAYEHANTDSLFMVIEKTIGHYAQKISFGIEGDQDSGIGGSSYAWNLAIGKIIVTTKKTEGSSTLLYNIILNKTTYQ